MSLTKPSATVAWYCTCLPALTGARCVRAFMARGTPGPRPHVPRCACGAYLGREGRVVPADRVQSRRGQHIRPLIPATATKTPRQPSTPRSLEAREQSPATLANVAWNATASPSAPTLLPRLSTRRRRRDGHLRTQYAHPTGRSQDPPAATHTPAHRGQTTQHARPHPRGVRAEPADDGEGTEDGVGGGGGWGWG